MKELSILQEIDNYLNLISYEKEPSTVKSYDNGLTVFISSLKLNGISPENTSVKLIKEDWIRYAIEYLNPLSSRTEALYLAAIRLFYDYLRIERIAEIDIEKVRKIINNRPRRPPARSKKEVDYYRITNLINFLQTNEELENKDIRIRLRAHRDLAFVLMLADIDLNLEVICRLRKDHLDLRRGQILFQDESIPLSPRLKSSLKNYLDLREEFDYKYRNRMGSLPVIARHDRGAGQNILPITTTTGRNIIKSRAQESLSEKDAKQLSPRSFRRYSLHSLISYFQMLHPLIDQKCRVLFEIGHYDEAIFNAMKIIETEVRDKIKGDPTDRGSSLISKAMSPNNPILRFSTIQREQEAIFFLYSGAIGAFKNPQSHRFVNTTNPHDALEQIAFASMLLKMLENL